jgi:hypothetical protein
MREKVLERAGLAARQLHQYQSARTLGTKPTRDEVRWRITGL